MPDTIVGFHILTYLILTTVPSIWIFGSLFQMKKLRDIAKLPTLGRPQLQGWPTFHQVMFHKYFLYVPAPYSARYRACKSISP